MSLEVWLVRHGETFSNVSKIIQGASSELTDKGKIQAKKIGMRLKNERYDLVAVSDLHRTKQTWDEITKLQGDQHSEAKGNLIFDPRLREKCGGSLEG